MHKSNSMPVMTSKSSSPSKLLTSKPSVHFLPPSNLSSLLADYSESNSDVIDGLITHLKNQRGPTLLLWLDAVERNVSTLKPKLEAFVMALLGAVWDLDQPQLQIAFKHFLATLITAHIYYTKPVIKMLVGNLVGRPPEEPSLGEEQRIFDVSLETIGQVLEMAPIVVQTELILAIKTQMPYMLTKELNRQSQYIHNCLRLCTIVDHQTCRLSVFNLVIERLLQLDALLPPINTYEDEGSEYAVTNDTIVFLMEPDVPRSVRDRAVAEHTLDRCMSFAFDYVAQGVEKKRSRALYSDLQHVFMKQMLPTHNTGHTHFLIFLFLGLEEQRYLNHFLELLWSTFLDPNNSTVIRMASMAYLGSLMARGKFVDLELLKQQLQRMVTWLHHYINTQRDKPMDVACADLKGHGPFYGCCQSAFYLLAFRHSELVQREKELSYLRRLSLNSIITSSLNPLNVIVKPVVKNFCAVARHYQFAYCDSIVQRNSRLTLPVVNRVGEQGGFRSLDAFFPFDPYLLRSSKHYVDPVYREYNGTIDSDDFDNDSDDDDEATAHNDKEEESTENGHDFIDLCLGDLETSYNES